MQNNRKFYWPINGLKKKGPFASRSKSTKRKSEPPRPMPNEDQTATGQPPASPSTAIVPPAAKKQKKGKQKRVQKKSAPPLPGAPASPIPIAASTPIQPRPAPKTPKETEQSRPRPLLLTTPSSPGKGCDGNTATAKDQTSKVAGRKSSKFWEYVIPVEEQEQTNESSIQLLAKRKRVPLQRMDI